jgi:hypothetical protein
MLGWRRTVSGLAFGIALLAARAVGAAEPSATLEAPATVPVGSSFQVRWTGPGAPQDFISIDRPDANDATYGTYAYPSSGNPLTLKAPDEAGRYLLRYHLAGDYRVIGTAALEVSDVTATLEAPASSPAGSAVAVKWTGPDNAGDFIAIDKPGAPDRTYGPYAYTQKGSPATIAAPDQPGEYVVRYHMASSYRVLASAPLTLTSTSAVLEVPASIPAGATLDVKWTGPDQPRDFISIDRRDAPDHTYGPYAYTSKGSPAKVRVPDEPGDYTVRYHMASSYRVLGSTPIVVADVTATLDAPMAAPAKSRVEVAWTGPDSVGDFISIDEPKSPPKSYGTYDLTVRGNPLRVPTPDKPGTYELRYHTGATYRVLATRTLEVTPAAGGKSGRIHVVSRAGTSAVGYPTVEVVLDASGSMLQRLGKERRIELARKALLEFARDVLPDDTAFALRVFGHREADACRSDLELPLARLDRPAVLARIQAVQAQNQAKTPIGESLRLVKDDLAGASGPAMVVLVTDGEETCDGDPLAAIGELRQAGFDVRVSIVGFAIDDPALARTFAHWAQAGDGTYIDAKDGAALARALRTSFAPRFEVRAGDDVVASGVVDGAAVDVAPGSYTVRILSNPAKDVSGVAVESEKQRDVEY